MSRGVDKAMADIFISYAREDRRKVQLLVEAFEGRGWSVWWDTRLKAGEIWDDVIERELNATRCVVVLWSKTSVQKHWVRVEASEGLARQILVPAFIEDVRPSLAFRLIQAEHLIDWSGDSLHPGLNRLLAAVSERLRAQNLEEINRQPAVEVVAVTATSRKRRQASRRANTSARVNAQLLHDLAVFRDVGAPWCPEMVVLPAGTFLMGSLENEVGRESDESPQHRVTISRRFAIGRYPVAFDEYDHFCTAAKREKPGDNGWGRGRRPVINVNWWDAQAYVDWLAKETGKPYRLPTEAEWEYACRAGTTTRYFFGNEITPKDANYWESKPGKTTEVGAYPPNPWGLYDMHGNVWEWCADWRRNYTADAVTDPVGPTEPGAYRMFRGGSWYYFAQCVRSAYRRWFVPGRRNYSIGFRCARVQEA